MLSTCHKREFKHKPQTVSFVEKGVWSTFVNRLELVITKKKIFSYHSSVIKRSLLCDTDIPGLHVTCYCTWGVTKPISSVALFPDMMTSSNGNRVTGHLCGESTGPRWIAHTKASDAELWCFFDLRLKNGWVNNGEAGDLKRYRAHYDVTVMNYSVLPKTHVICWISH